MEAKGRGGRDSEKGRRTRKREGEKKRERERKDQNLISDLRIGPPLAHSPTPIFFFSAPALAFAQARERERQKRKKAAERLASLSSQLQTAPADLDSLTDTDLDNWASLLEAREPSVRPWARVASCGRSDKDGCVGLCGKEGCENCTRCVTSGEKKAAHREVSERPYKEMV